MCMFQLVSKINKFELKRITTRDALMKTNFILNCQIFLRFIMILTGLMTV